MKILHRVTGEILFWTEEDTLRRADLREVDLRWVTLKGADLREADLRRADLREADLTDTKMPETGLEKYRKGKHTVYKYVNKDRSSPQFPGLTYKDGKVIEMKEGEFDRDERNTCSTGINVATREWVEKNKQEGTIVIALEIEGKDVIAIPHATDGKFRVRKARVIGEVKA